MHLFSSVDWGFLEAFFGEYGKLVTATLAVVGAFVGLAIVLFKYLHARILEKERDAARGDLQKSKAALEKEKARVQEQQRALREKEADLDCKDGALITAVYEIKSREQKLNAVRAAFIDKEQDLLCIHAPRKA